MSKGAKTTTTQTQQQANTFRQITPQNTADTDALRNFQFQGDPTAPYRNAQAKQSLHESYHNPYGAYTTPAVRDAAIRTGEMNLNQQQGQQSAEENATLNNMRYGQLAGLAEMTAPRIVQTGGTSSGTGTSQQSGGLGQLLLSSALSGGGATA